jgi:hypothetical protein
MVALVCDAPQRAECKGCKGHMGYYACERCVTRGVNVPGWGIKFVELNRALRKDIYWASYLHPPFGEKVCEYFKLRMSCLILVGNISNYIFHV